jgi:hypothetical protein
MERETWDGVEQPSDDEVAGSPWFFQKTYREFHKGLQELLKELERHRSLVEKLELTVSPFEEEVEDLRRMVEWGEEKLAERSGSGGSIIVNGVTFGSLRYLKAGILYRAYLVDKQKRDFLSENKLVPRSVLRTFDDRIKQLRNIGESGKFLSGLRPADVLFEVTEGASETQQTQQRPLIEPARAHASPLVEVPIVDELLRNRCLPLLKALDGERNSEQFDTVIREMSVVLEDRVREVSGFVGKASGGDLFSAVMAKDAPLIRFSSERDVQEAAHLFFRGYSGLVRNEVMHRLVRRYTRERVLQLLGLVDYLLHLLSNAEVTGR